MTQFPTATQEHIRLAIIDEMTNQKLGHKERLLLLMRDGEWHSSRELSLKVSHRFSSYLKRLTDDWGIEWEKREDPNAPAGEQHWDYRLVAEGGPQLF